MLNADIIKVIKDAVSNKSNPHTVTFHYVKADGTEKMENNIGVYEIRDGKVWGDKGGEIRQFALERIDNIRKDATTFQPRFPIKVGA